MGFPIADLILNIPPPAGPLAPIVFDPAHMILVSTARQIGKTNQFLRWLFKKATECPKPFWECWYCCPTYKWGKRVAWKILKSLIPPELMRSRPNNSELSIELINGVTISIKGMDRFNDMVGNALYALVLDEFGSMKAGTWDYMSASFATTDGYLIIGGTPRPYGNPDFVKYYHETAKGERDDFKLYPVFKTADSPFVSKAFIEDRRKNMTPKMFAQEYLGDWVCFEGQMFQINDLERACRPWTGYVDSKVRAWDLATTKHNYSDYTAGGLFGRDADLMLFMDLVHGKWEYPEARSMIIETAKKDGPEVPIVIEGVGGFLAVAQDIKNILEPEGYTVITEKRGAGQDKLTMSSPVQAKIANDNFIFLQFQKQQQALDEWKGLSFDQRTWIHDDILDTASMAHKRLFNYVDVYSPPILGGRR